VTARTLILRSLRFHARAHLGVVLGAAVGSAALIGALVVGDSVRGSLREMALQRLDGIEYAVAPADRFFREDLRHDLASALRNSKLAEQDSSASRVRLGAYREGSVTTALRLAGTVARQDGAARANRVQVLSLGPGLDHFVHQPALTNFPADGVILNESLARQLHARPGDQLVLRIRKASALSHDVAISPRDDNSVALRLRVHFILPADALGNFALESSQVPPLNAFVRADTLQKALALEGRANLVLAGNIWQRWPPASPPSFVAQAVRWWRSIFPGQRRVRDEMDLQESVPTPQALALLSGALRSHWKLQDAEAELRLLPEQGAVELRSSRIFLDAPIAQAALASTNALDSGRAAGARAVLTYLVNQLRANDRTTPYSMVTAAGPPWTPPDLGADEIVINQWLADDLQIKPGDTLDLTYFLPESGARLVERTNRFRVRSVVPLSGVHADRTLMPEFPGVAKAESTHDWDAGFPLVHKIRDQDETYWKEHRGTPKAFITLAAGQAMWGNRFGSLTAVRFPLPPGVDAENFRLTVERSLLQNMYPASVGLRFEPVRAQALAAANQAQDFGQLFLGFSFFLIIAALILMALLFQFGLEQRTTEVGTLLALGFSPKQVRSLLLREGIALAAIGGVVGVAAGIAFARALLHGLTTIWRDAVGTSALSYHATARSLIIGLIASVVIGAVTIALVLRRQARRSARELLAEGADLEFQISDLKSPGQSRGTMIAIISAALALLIVGWALWAKETAAAGGFFGAGSLLLISALACVATLLTALGRSASAKSMSVSSLGLRGATRRRKRSLATVGLLACGSFLVVAIGAFKLDANREATKRSSGTGGFALMGESSLAVVHDLNTTAGREFFGLDDASLAGVEVVQLRVRDGDDASCLNLNRAQRPRLLGVKPELLSTRQAFTFAKAAKGYDRTKGWGLLSSRRRVEAGGGFVVNRPSTHAGGDNEIPAIGDAASIQWALGKKIGDTIEYTNDRGGKFKVRLVAAIANSILQGSLLIDEAEFVKRFPGESGYRMFLIDAPSNSVATASATLTRALQDVGLELTPTAQRLAAFNAVQNTYLNTFQVLGGLGLLLGSAGLGVVVLRNVFERRGELALLQAVGFRRRKLQWLVLSEHGGLLLLGLAAGVVAALVAILPMLLAPGAEIHYLSLGSTLGAILISGLVWTWVATRLALRGELLKALRNE